MGAALHCSVGSSSLKRNKNLSNTKGNNFIRLIVVNLTVNLYNIEFHFLFFGAKEITEKKGMANKKRASITC